MHTAPPPKLRSPLGLNVTGGPNGVVLVDASTQGRWVVDNLDRHLVRLLQFCRAGRTVDEATKALAASRRCSTALARKAVDALRAAGLLVPDDDGAEVPPLRMVERWERKGWREPLYFHVRTNLLPKTDYGSDSAYRDDVGTMRRKVEAEPVLPSNYKDYEDAPFTAFAPYDPAAARDMAAPTLEEVLLERPVTFPERSLDLAELGTFMYLAYGQTAVRKLPVTGAHVAKTSPSGGSRHPTEAYAVVLDVEGLAPGIYHYSVRRHGLELLAPGDHGDATRQHVFLSAARPPFHPRVVFIYTTIFERSMFRYREPRSYRVMHFDLGHLMQTTAYLARARNRNCYRAYAMHDADVERLIGVDGIREAAMAYSAIG